jgi:hypothetical protein
LFTVAKNEGVFVYEEPVPFREKKYSLVVIKLKSRSIIHYVLTIIDLALARAFSVILSEVW